MPDIKFQKLIPAKDASVDGYEDAFEFVFENDDIRNVAIFGPYGAGKSSVLQTYAEKHKDRKFLYISLAHFDWEKMDGVQESTVENSLERKILNHLVNQIPLKDIPHTRMPVNRQDRKWPYVLITLGIAIIVAALIYFTHMTEWSHWLEDSAGTSLAQFLQFTTRDFFRVILAILAVAALSFGLYRLILLQAEGRLIKKLSFQGAEAELSSEEHDSYFDRYPSEVRYLLEQVKADAIVFEDIDRYDNVEIFEKIREINALGNYQRKPPIRFFYVMRDDLMSAEDRTKFFDYIIPIVPFINGSNSYEKLTEYLKETAPSHHIDDYFLREMSLYIDDVRLIKTMVNEFEIMECKLRQIEPDHNKLWAIVAYKNMFPKDYVRLQRGQGYVFRVFKNWEMVLDSEIQTTESGEKRVLNQFTLAESINGVLNDQRLIPDAQNEEEKNAFEEVQGNRYFELLKYFIANGYIDESYNDYLTFFYPGTLTLNDKIFLRSIANAEGKPYAYPLDDAAMVERWIKPSKFYRKEVLNYGLMRHLLHSAKGEIYLPAVIMQLRENNTLEFITSFYQTDLDKEEKDDLVILLNKEWPEFFSLIWEQAKEDESLHSLVREYSERSLLKCEDKVLKIVNKDECLSDYVSSQPDYLKLNLTQPEKETLIHAFQDLNVEFVEISKECSDDTLLDMVYEAWLYDMNAENLRLFLQSKYDDSLAGDSGRCITLIHSRPEEPLCQYFDWGQEKGLAAVLDFADGALCDEEAEEIALLNNSEISEEMRQSYLLRSTTKITNLKEINEASFYTSLLLMRQVIPSADNVLCYFLKLGLTDELAEFLNDVEDKMEYSSVELSPSERKNYVQGALQSAELSKERFREIVNWSPKEISGLFKAGLPVDKVEVLAEEGLIPMNVQNLKLVREEYNTAKRDYIGFHMSQYAPLVTTAVLKEEAWKEEVVEIFSWSEVSIKWKVALFKKGVSYLQPMHLHLKFDLLDALLKEQGVADSTKWDLAQDHIAELDPEQRDIVLMDLGGEDIVVALKRNHLKCVPLTKTNRDLLQMLKDTRWIRDYEPREKEGVYHFTPIYGKN